MVGVLPPLFALLRSPHDNVRMLALMTIHVPDRQTRDQVLAVGDAVPALINCAESSRSIEEVVGGLDLLACLCDHEPPMWLVDAVLPVAIARLQESDIDVATMACLVVSHICDSNENDRTTLAIVGGALPLLTSRLRSDPTNEQQWKTAKAMMSIITNAPLSHFESIAFGDIVRALLGVPLCRTYSLVALLCVDAIVGRANVPILRSLCTIAADQLLIDDCVARCESARDRDGAFRKLGLIVAKLERFRFAEIGIALQTLDLPALVTVTIVEMSSATAVWMPFHRKWAIVTKVKHFKTDPC